MTLPKQALQQAIEWRVLHGDGDLSAEDQANFSAWLQADPANAQAWESLGVRMDRVLGRVQPALAPPASALRQALLQPTRKRRDVVGRLFGLGVVCAGGLWLLDRQMPIASVLADYSTGTAQRQTQILPDGSVLQLDARSRVKLRFDARQRHIELLAGAVHVKVAHDEHQRPLRVLTAQGLVQAMGTRFMVRQDEGSSLAVVDQHSVVIRNRAGMEVALQEGSGTRFYADRLEDHTADLFATARWQQGVVEVHDQPLSDVLDALRPYYPGILRVAPKAAAIRITGVFPLDDPQRTLMALVHTTPIRLTQYSRWVSVIEHL